MIALTLNELIPVSMLVGILLGIMYVVLSIYLYEKATRRIQKARAEIGDYLQKLGWELTEIDQDQVPWHTRFSVVPHAQRGLSSFHFFLLLRHAHRYNRPSILMSACSRAERKFKERERRTNSIFN